MEKKNEYYFSALFCAPSSEKRERERERERRECDCAVCICILSLTRLHKRVFYEERKRYTHLSNF